MTAHPAPRSAARRRSSFAARKRSLLVGCALGAAAALLAQPQRASAQAFEATPVFTTPNVNRSITGPTTETITISPTLNGSTTAIINWSFTDDNFDATYDFLPAGNIATFQSAIGENFAVLNRVIIPRPIEFNGRVISQLQQDVGDPLRGGTVIFTNASGIIVSDTAVFDVGNLVLSTLQIETQDETGYGPYFDPNDLSFTLGNGNPNARVVTEAGSQINAPAEGSYVAMIAPIVTHGGTVDVNGSAAYIAAEDLRMTINNGLFDIEVDVGTDNANPLTHTGTTGGPAEGGGGPSGDLHRIYMVAVPKNQAISALLTGNIGFDAATDATVDNGVIVLSAGFDVDGDTAQANGSSLQPASFEVRDVQITSPLSGFATTDMFMGGGVVNSTQRVSLYARERARLFAEAGDTTTVLFGRVESNRLEPTGEAVGGEALAFAQGSGVLTVHAGLTVDASAEGVGGDGVNDATGGTARVYADGGSVLVGDTCSGCTVTVLADGTGGNGFFVAGGAGTGGTAAIEAFNGGTVELAGGSGFNDVLVRADGTGGDGFFGVGGSGTGGTASVEAFDGGLVTMTVPGAEVDVSARGFGGTPEFGYGALPGGDGIGGTVSILAGNGGNLVMLGESSFDASGYGGTAGPASTGGTGTGGTVEIRIDSPDARIELGAVEAIAGGFGGTGGEGDSGPPATAGGPGGEGVGGDVVVDVVGELTLVSLAADARGQGGEGGKGGTAFGEDETAGAGGAGGDGTGGTVVVATRGGSIEATGAAGIEASADGVGGTGGAGGDIYTSTAVEGEGGDGGDGFGGSAELNIVGGRVQTPATTIEANGFAGAGGPSGQVGTPAPKLPNGGGAGKLAPAGASTARVPGNAGTATGGTATISIADGDPAVGSASLGSMTLDASAYNPAGTGAAAGGVAGRAVFEDSAGGTVQLADLTVDLTGAASPDGPAFEFTSSNRPVLVGAAVTIDTQGDIVFTATGTGGLRAGGAVDVGTAQSIQLTHNSRPAGSSTVAGGSIDFVAGESVEGSANSRIAATAGNVRITAPLVDIGRVSATGFIDVEAGDIVIVRADSGGDIDLDATDDIVVGVANAGDDFLADAGGSFTADLVTANVGSDIIVNSVGDLTLDDAEATGLIQLISTSGDVRSSGLLDAGTTLYASAGGAIDINDGSAGGAIQLSAPGAIDARDLSSGGYIIVQGSAGVTLASTDSVSFTTIIAGAAADLGNVEAGASLYIQASSIDADRAVSGEDATLQSPGDIAVGFGQAGDDFTATAGGTFAADELVATGLGFDSETGYGGTGDGGSIIVNASGDLRLDDGDAAGRIRLNSSHGSVTSAGLLEAGGAIDIDAAEDATLTELASGGDIEIDAGDDIVLVEADAGDDFLATAGGSFTADLVTANVGSDIIVTSAGDLTLDDAEATGIIDLESTGGSVISGGLLDAGTTLTVQAGVDIDFNNAEAGSSISLFADRAIDATSLASGGSIFTNSGGATTIGAAEGAASVTIFANGPAELGAVQAGQDLYVDASAIDADSAIAGGDATLVADGDIRVGFGQAGDDFRVTTAGVFSGDELVATGLGPDSEADEGSPGDGGSITVLATDGIRLDRGDAAGYIQLISSGQGISSGGTLEAGAEIYVDGAGDVVIQEANAGTSFTGRAGGGFTADSVTAAGGDINVSSNADLVLNDAEASGAIQLSSEDGSVSSAGLLDAGGFLSASAASDIDLNRANAGTGLNLSAQGSIDAVALTGGSVFTNSGGATTIGTSQSDASTAIIAGGAADLGAVTAGGPLFVSADSIDAGSLVAGGDATLFADADIAVGFGQAGDDFVAIADGSFTGNRIVATGLGPDSEAGYGSTGDGSNINIAATGDIRLDDGDAAGFIQLVSSEAGVTGSTRLEAGSSVFVSGTGDIDLNGIDAGTTVYIVSDGAIGAGDVVAGDSITAVADDSVTVGSAQSGGSIYLDAGAAAQTGALNAGTSIDVFGGSVVVAGATAGNDITLFAGSGSVAIGSAQAGDDFRATAGGTVTATNVVTTGLGADNEAGYGSTSGEGSNIFIDGGGNVRLDTGQSAGEIRLTSTSGSVLSDVSLTAAGGVAATAAGDIVLNDADAGGAVRLDADGAIDANDLTGGFIDVTAGDSVVLVSAMTDSGINIIAGGAADLGSLATGNAAGGGDSIFVSAGSIQLDRATAVFDIQLESEGELRVTFAQAGETLLGAPNGRIRLSSTGGDITLDAAQANDVIELTAGAGSVLSAGYLDAGGGLTIRAADDIRLNSAYAVDDSPPIGRPAMLLNAGGAIVAANLEAYLSLSAFSGGTMTIGSARSDVHILLQAGGAADLGTVEAGGRINVSAEAIVADSLTAATDVNLLADDDVAVNFAQAGDDFRVVAGGPVTVASAVTTGLGGDNEVGYGAGAGEGSSIIITADGDVRLGDGDAADAILLASFEGDVLSDQRLEAGGQVAVSAAGSADLAAVTAGLNVELGAGGDLNADGITAGGDIDILVGGGVDADATRSGGSTVILAGDLIDLGSVDADGDVEIAGGSVVASSIVSDASVSVGSEGAASVQSLVADGSAALGSGGDMTVGFAVVQGDFSAEAGGDFAGGNVTAGGDILVEAEQDLRLDNGVAGATMRLTSSGGDILGGQSGADSLGSLQAGGDLIATASGDIDLGRAQAGGDMILDAGADLTARGDLRAGGLLDARAGGNATFADVQAADASFQVIGTASFGGVVLAQTIAVTSSDIDIGASGGLGGEGTRLVALTARATGRQTVIGGDAQGPGYTLTAAEAGRITAGTLRITAPANGHGGNRAPDVMVRDVTFDAGRVGQLELLTGGILEVQGNLLLANAGLTNGISIRADERLQVVTPTGSIRVRDADGLPGGVLTLTSNNIWAGSRALLDRLTADPNFAGRDAALTQNDGPIEPRGYIEGGEVFLAARDSVFVQNSGTAEQFAGITVVQNTLTITPTGESPLSVFAFGRRINPDGSFVTNDDYFAEVEFAQGSAGYTDESQFNLCFINTRDCGAPPPEPEPVPEFPDGPDPIKEPIDPLAPPNVNTDLVDTSFAGEPLIEEPVTSGADSILWDCEDEDDDGVCDEDNVDE